MIQMARREVDFLWQGGVHGSTADLPWRVVGLSIPLVEEHVIRLRGVTKASRFDLLCRDPGT